MMKSKIMHRMQAADKACVNTQLNQVEFEKKEFQLPVVQRQDVPKFTRHKQQQHEKEGLNQNTLNVSRELLLYTKHQHQHRQQDQDQDQDQDQNQNQNQNQNQGLKQDDQEGEEQPEKQKEQEIERQQLPSLQQPGQEDEQLTSSIDGSSKSWVTPNNPINSNCISSSKSCKWEQNFQELVNFRRLHGHCQVPHQRSGNMRLAKWVKKQRYESRLKKDGLRSPMTDSRQEALNNIGFEWDPQDARWEEQLNDLRAYKKVSKTCNVPSTCTYIPGLAHWVKSQRRQYRNFKKGKHSTLTNERIMKLNELGFIWNPRNLKLDDYPALNSSSSSTNKQLT